MTGSWIVSNSHTFPGITKISLLTYKQDIDIFSSFLNIMESQMLNLNQT